MNASNLKRPSETNWARVDEMTDEMIDTSDAPPLDDSFFARAKLRMPGGQMIVRMHVDEGQESQDDDEEFNDGSTLFDYLASKKGHEITKEIVSLVREVKNVTIDASAQEKKATLEFQRQIRREQSIVQLVVFALSLVLVSVLTYFGKFDSGVAVLLGTLVGYFFGRGQLR
jgi:hypothetical protein